MKGRKRTPAELHVVRGSFRKDRHGEQPDATPSDRNVVKKPAYLKGRAGRIWNARAPALAALGVLQRNDAEMFGIWCTLAAEFEESPSAMNAARISQLRGLAASFGLSPSDRQHIVPNRQPAPDEFDEFLNRRYFDE